MIFFKKKRRFYVKVNGLYLTTKTHTTPKFYTNDKAMASTYTDKEYDSIKRMLNTDHTLELVK